jgi:DNA-binding protein HU-beta
MPQIILVEKSAVIPATPARLYKSLTDAKQLSRWLADEVQSDPREGGQIVIDYDTHEKRGEYRRLIPGVEVGIRWHQFEEPVPIDITGFKLDKVAQGTRVRVVDFALPEDAAELQSLWARRLKRLKTLYPVSTAKKAPSKKAASKKAMSKKAAARKTSKRKSAVKTKTTARRTVTRKAQKKA